MRLKKEIYLGKLLIFLPGNSCCSKKSTARLSRSFDVFLTNNLKISIINCFIIFSENRPNNIGLSSFNMMLN